MSDIIRRGFFSALFALAFSWAVFSRFDEEYGSENTSSGRQRYLPLIPVIVLPAFLVILWGMGLIFRDIQWTLKATLSMCFSIFLHISLYYLILMPLLPLLRRHISARACAMLWVIPNYLYITINELMALPAPAVVLTVPGNLVLILLRIWFVGFVAVLGWKIFGHIRFRRMILKDAVPPSNILWKQLLYNALLDARYPELNIPLMVSPKVSTPLTIGLYKSTAVVVLPRRQYTREELELILRHEVVHICREDAWNKFFLMFCTAMCWFNPLMWRAMKKSAEDLELSCDETVLLDADDDDRRQYARLVLNTAGDERGFTTCLSASADALRYRLKRIMEGPVMRSGAAIVGVTFFLLSVTCGTVALAYNGQTGAEVIYQSQDPASMTLVELHPGSHDGDIEYHVNDAQALSDYLSGLTMYEVTGNYTFEHVDRWMSLFLRTQNGRLHLYLTDTGIQLWHYGQAIDSLGYYHVPEGIDWDFLESLIVERPTLEVWLLKDNFEKGHTIDTTMTSYWRLEDGERSLLREYPAPEHGLSGFHATEATLVFSQAPVSECTVLVEGSGLKESYTVTLDPADGALRMDLLAYSTRYIVTAQFLDEAGNLYEAEYQFYLGG